MPEYNIFLKLKKSNFGILLVEFFGYLCQHKSYRLTDERKLSVTAIPFPEGHDRTKQMQRFLGSSMYFAPFIPEYSKKTALLTEMTHKKFQWEESTWAKDYRRSFREFKEAILEAVELYHPDYELEWILRCDASEVGVGAVLMQVHIFEDGVRAFQPITFVSMKFSEVAGRWHIMDK